MDGDLELQLFMVVLDLQRGSRNELSVNFGAVIAAFAAAPNAEHAEALARAALVAQGFECMAAESVTELEASTFQAYVQSAMAGIPTALSDASSCSSDS